MTLLELFGAVALGYVLVRVVWAGLNYLVRRGERDADREVRAIQRAEIERMKRSGGTR